MKRTWRPRSTMSSDIRKKRDFPRNAGSSSPPAIPSVAGELARRGAHRRSASKLAGYAREITRAPRFPENAFALSSHRTPLLRSIVTPPIASSPSDAGSGTHRDRDVVAVADSSEGVRSAVGVVDA